MNVSLPSSVATIEFYVGLQDVSYFQISATDSNGGTFSSGWFHQTNAAVPLFFGITTDSTFTSLSITAYSSPDIITLDDISIGSAGTGETPEAATLLLVATGLFLMGWMRRRMPRRAAGQAASRGTVRTMSTGITPA
jgi:hypothetical protein